MCIFSVTFSNRSHKAIYDRLSAFLLTQKAQKKSLAKEKRRKGDFASAEATADLGGSGKPLKRLERNFPRGRKPEVYPLENAIL